MNFKKLVVPVIAIIFMAACGGGQEGGNDSGTETPAESKILDKEVDYSKGIGKFKDVTLSPTLDVQLAVRGGEVYDLKCSSCHRLEGPRLVGPSWDGITERREPEWILNFITNVDEMLEKDPEAMAQLEECLIRMPNQNVSDEDAFALLEYMRQNDGVE